MISGTRTAVSVAAMAHALLGRLGGVGRGLAGRALAWRLGRTAAASAWRFGVGLAARLRRRCSPRSRASCVASQALNAAGRDRADLRDHVGVVAPAQLGALARDRRPASSILNHVKFTWPGHGVELAAELRDPPGVGDVLRLDVERDGRLRRARPARRRRRRCSAGCRRLVGVRVAPDVALAVDLDVQRAAVRRAGLEGGGVLDVGTTRRSGSRRRRSSAGCGCRRASRTSRRRGRRG